MMTMDVGMYNNQQNGYTGAEYYQQGGSSYQPPYEGYHEGYYENPAHYYEPVLHGQAAHDHTPPVISTDAGLCYTNLDYGELQQNYPLHGIPNNEQFKHRDELQRHDDLHATEHKLDGHYLEAKYNMHFVDDSSMSFNHAASPLPCADYEHYQPKEEFGLRDRFSRDGDCLSSPHGSLTPGLSSSQSPHSAVPTYKWMQVKRNVPKPSGE